MDISTGPESKGYGGWGKDCRQFSKVTYSPVGGQYSVNNFVANSSCIISESSHVYENETQMRLNKEFFVCLFK